ncbi:cell division protein FtsQ/DivIB [Natroniella acetigena]|uniref:cell division protein FtsQ/DivIB n=1 Tax=Natroniella acetigena TaxID=52004 RepID=UPI00200B8673|nr:cell division protein FtsQ/DivIB [Natroniella acetigena]MCK8827144.1 cell division protein FtsQ/DivIB [Natroniella acetigena]
MDKHYVYIITLCLLVIFAIIGIMNSEIFKIENIEVNGNDLLTDKEIIDYSNLEGDINIFSLESKQIADKLIQLSQIQGAVVTRSFPREVIIEINERRAIGIVGNENSYLIIDSEGWILDDSYRLSDWRLPLITGSDILIENEKIKLNKMLEKTTRYLNLLNNSILEEISEINITAEDEIKLFLRDGGEVRLGDGFDLKYKAEVFTAIYQDLKDKNLEVDYIDLRYQKNKVVKVK